MQHGTQPSNKSETKEKVSITVVTMEVLFSHVIKYSSHFGQLWALILDRLQLDIMSSGLEITSKTTTRI